MPAGLELWVAGYELLGLFDLGELGGDGGGGAGIGGYTDFLADFEVGDFGFFVVDFDYGFVVGGDDDFFFLALFAGLDGDVGAVDFNDFAFESFSFGGRGRVGGGGAGLGRFGGLNGGDREGRRQTLRGT